MASETTSKGIAFMDPSAESNAVRVAMAPRPSTLDGKVMALFDNGKPNANRLAQMVGDLIREKYNIKDVTLTGKGDFSRPAAKELMDKITEERGFDFAIVAVGD
jgi:hypothetical protein